MDRVNPFQPQTSCLAYGGVALVGGSCLAHGDSLGAAGGQLAWVRLADQAWLCLHWRRSRALSASTVDGFIVPWWEVLLTVETLLTHGSFTFYIYKETCDI